MRNGELNTLSISIDSNPTDMIRTGSITITTPEGERTISIQQDAATAEIEVSQTTLNVDAGGGAYSIDVSSNVRWYTFYDVDWISRPFASGIGNNDVTIVVDANDGPEARSAIFRIEGGGVSKTISIKQAAASN